MTISTKCWTQYPVEKKIFNMKDIYNAYQLFKSTLKNFLSSLPEHLYSCLLLSFAKYVNLFFQGLVSYSLKYLQMTFTSNMINSSTFVIENVRSLKKLKLWLFFWGWTFKVCAKLKNKYFKEKFKKSTV